MAEASNMNNLPAPSGAAGMPSIADNPWLRQLAVMVGIAASVALGVAVVLWSQAPNYAPLYGNLAEKDASQIMEALQQSGVSYRVDEATGMLLVPTSKLKEIRMQLAGQGLPNSIGMGFELMQQDTGFGTSQMVEKARYQQAMQGELARTISTIGAVQSARVHLAIPKQSVFVRKRQPPSASVALRLHGGRVLEDAQVDAIVHLVASGIPELQPGRVTVVDHKGRLLSGSQESREMKLSATQFEHTRRIEEHYRDRIVDLLAPIVGSDKVRAQVTADIDFTVTEQTQERYNPDQPALRSEQLNEEQSGGAGAGGVPGALTNQPPAAGNAPEQAEGGGGLGGNTSSSSRQSTRNYELDRVISHTRMSPLSVRRLSVAVVVDDVRSADAEGKPQVRERTPEEIERLTALVREAIGFDTRRGDSVRVMNSSFLTPEPVADLPEVPIWEQGWFLDIVKQVGGLLLVLILIFVVLRPTMKRLTASHTELATAGAGTAAAGDTEGARVEGPLGHAGEGGDDVLLGSDGEPVKLPGGGRYENIMDAARNLVDEDPKRVAQLVKTWMNEEAA